jgi:signal transduction histidine kinase
MGRNETGFPDREREPESGFQGAGVQTAEDRVLGGMADALRSNAVVAALLDAFDGMVAIVNSGRQVVAINAGFLRKLGVSSPEEIHGLRPGDIVKCVNADRSPGGCGDGGACELCGAARAVLESQATGAPASRECLLRVVRGGFEESLEFNVLATPIRIEGKDLTVLCFRDISHEKRRRILEHVFFHDVLNTVAGLHSWSELLKKRSKIGLKKAPERIASLAQQLEREIRDQRGLLMAESGQLNPEFRPVEATQILDVIREIYAGHRVAEHRNLELSPEAPQATLISNRTLAVRVVSNMVKNAFEATLPGGTVRLWGQISDGRYGFRVWNPAVIPPKVAERIFQRYFSTKNRHGRGLGTYAMKLFGERYLGGEVGFTSTEEEGTIFSLWLRFDPPETKSIPEPGMDWVI